MRPFSATRAAAVVGLLASAGLAGPSGSPAFGQSAHTIKVAGSQTVLAGEAALPTVTSGNVHHLANVPDTTGISGVFSPSAPYFYMSSTKSISVYDVSNPSAPKLTGILDNLVFENEAMNYGERTNRDGSVTRFVLVGVDLYQASSSDIRHTSPAEGRKRVLVVDVTDPTRPYIRSSTPALTSTHTVSCVDVRNCTTAYTAGSNLKTPDDQVGKGYYSVISLTNLDRPFEVDAKPKVAGTQPFPSPQRVRAALWQPDTSGTSTTPTTASTPAARALRSSTSPIHCLRNW